MDINAFRKILPSMIDLSCVGAANTHKEISEMAEMAVKLRCAAVFAMPANTEFLCSLMSGTEIAVGGVVGFPSGCEETDTKLFIAEKLLKYGCSELDMVINQSWLKSGMDEKVINDISSVARLCGEIPLKVILEVNNLTDEEIKRGCKIAEQSGAAFVKSGTGRHKKPTELRHIQLMKDAVSKKVKIKAAGGIKDIETAHNMYLAGCTRFGESVHSARLLLGEN